MNRETIHNTGRFLGAELAAYLLASHVRESTLPLENLPITDPEYRYRNAAYDACELLGISTSLHRWEGRLCSVDIGEPAEAKGEARRQRLLQRAHEIAAQYGLGARPGSGDPRGCPLYLLTRAQVREAQGVSFHACDTTRWFPVSPHATG